MAQGKNFFASWTNWFGILQIALAAVGFFSGQLGAQEAGTLLTTGIGTIGLRLKTTQPIQ